MEDIIEHLNYFVYDSEAVCFDLSKAEAKKILEELERLNKIKEYCEESSLTMKSHYFSDILNIVEGGK